MENKELIKKLNKYCVRKISLERNLKMELCSYSLGRFLKKEEMSKGKLYRVQKLEKDIEVNKNRIDKIKKELKISKED